MAKIVDKLDNINNTLEKMLVVMEKPKHLFIRIIIAGGLIAAFLGILDYVDTIIRWVKEGIW